MNELKERHQLPEGALLERALAGPPKMSMRKLALAVEMSEGRVRQIINGYQSQAGQVLSIIGPAETLARLAAAAGVSAADLRAAGRGDAAELLSGMQRTKSAAEGRLESVTERQEIHRAVREYLERAELDEHPGPPPREFLRLYDVATLADATAEEASEVLGLVTTYHDALRARNDRIRDLEVRLFQEGGDGNADDKRGSAPIGAVKELSALDDEMPAAAKTGDIEESGEFNT